MPFLGHELMYRHYPTAVIAAVCDRSFATYCDYLTGRTVDTFSLDVPKPDRFKTEAAMARRHVQRTRTEWKSA
jgi:hypothetical protein